MVDRILKSILFLTPIAYYPGVFYYRFELMFFQISSILLFMACLIDQPKRQFNIGRLMALYLGICLFSVIINNYNLRSLSTLINILIGCLDVFIIIIYTQDLKGCFKWVGYGIILNSVIFIWQLMGYDPAMIKYPEQFFEHGGLIGNAPRFATLIALAVPFLSWWYMLPLLALGFLLKELSVFFSVVCVAFYRLYDLHKNYRLTFLQFKLTNLILIAVALVTILIFRDKISQSLDIRIPIWKETISQILNNPFKGWGLGNFRIYDYAQNSFLQWIHAVGILGAGFIFLALRKIKWYAIPLVFLCLVEHPFEIPRVWFLIIYIIAYWAVDTKEEVKIC